MKYSNFNNVKGFFISNNHFFLSNKNQLKCYDLNSNFQWEKEISGNIWKVLVYQEKAYVEFFDNETGFEKTSVISIANSNNLKNSLNSFMLRDISSNGLAITLKYNEDYSTNTFLIDLKTESIVWNKQFEELPHFINNSMMISGFNNFIKCINIDSSISWIFNTEILGNWTDYDNTKKPIEVSKVLGVYNNKVYIYLNDGKILVLNLKTGAKIAMLSNNKNINQGFFSGSFNSNIKLDSINNKLIQLFRKTYTEVDLNSGIVAEYEIKDMENLNIENITNFVFDDEFIYFSDKNNGNIGMLNRINLKIQWTYSLTQSKNNTYGKVLKIKGNYFYVLDNNNTLHIFDKTQNEIV